MPNLQLVLPLTAAPEPNPIPDAAARARALDTTQSFIVEAPAGSGKTGLLIQRFLKLLASDTVDDPAQILAITFTRKATAEMLSRVLAQLAATHAGTPPASDFDSVTRSLALAVLARDRKLGWGLLDHPARLNIRTIDSISAQIASALPVLSGSGGSQSPTDDASALYADAARRTLMLLADSDPPLHAALELLLLHRDGNLANCEALIASMLQTRDQWGSLVPLSLPELTDQFLDQTVLPKLDRALDRAVCQSLNRLSQFMPSHILNRLCDLVAEMGHADGYKGNPSPIALFAGNRMPPEEKSAHLHHWHALIDLLLTGDGSFRKGLTRNNVEFQIQRDHARELAEIIAAISHDEPLRGILCNVRALPSGQYPREQWPVAKALFRVLARALRELQLVFAERGQCDFAEIGLLARAALNSDSALDDLTSASGIRLQHLLVDEMQDTSTAQYEFLQLLTHSWDGHSQTVFLVGDPKQSIYLFRQARVERFIQTLASARLGDLPLTVLRLTANFRSVHALVASFNADFARIFPTVPDPNPDPAQPELLSYQPATAVRTGSGARVWHAAAIPSDAEPAVARAQAKSHAQQIRDVILTWRAKTLPPGRPRRADGNPEPWRIAVLVRSRAHLTHIIAALRQPDPIPFRAIEIDSLAERQEILDLLALTRALRHPGDKTAWLALLRSPWCGLCLADLHRLADGDDRTLAERTVLELIQTRGAHLSDDGIARLEPFWNVMDAALKQRGRLSLSEWVSRTWHAFGTPAFLSADALANAETFFQLLEQLEEPGGSVSLAHLQEKVNKLYAAPSTDPDAVDLMTLHKAKGLEWDVVLVPELHRSVRNNAGTLLSWLETGALYDEEIAAGILAPIARKGDNNDKLNLWIRSIATAREAAESKRLFYVACTRAQEELRLFAAPLRRKDGSISLQPDSLLNAAWPAAEPHFSPPSASVFTMPSPQILHEIAASAPAVRVVPRMVQRIPAVPTVIGQIGQSTGPVPQFERPEGGFAARAVGNAMHSWLELLAARIASGQSPEALLAELPSWQPRVAAVLRASGLAPGDLQRFTANLLRGLGKTLNDPEGRWILAPHPQAASESSLTTSTVTIRLDRTFLAGPVPLSHASTHLWIVDYKTATHGSGADTASFATFLAQEREKYAPQLETYARTLAATTTLPIRLALFYPMLPHLVWWEPEPFELIKYDKLSL